MKKLRKEKPAQHSRKRKLSDNTVENSITIKRSRKNKTHKKSNSIKNEPAKNKRKYSCSLCDKAYPVRDSLNRHMLHIHGTVEEKEQKKF